MAHELRLKDLKEEVLAKKMLFICLDGASKRILDKMLGDKELPFLASLINEGCLVPSTSFRPVCSPVIWTSIASGKVPEKHGITGFYQTSSSVKTKRLWEIFDDLGYPVGIMGHFLTWPPRKVNGFMIPDLLALDDQTHPEKYGFMWQITNDGKSDRRIRLKDLLRYSMQSAMNGISLPTLIQTGTELLRNKLFSSSILDRIYRTRIIKTEFHRDLFIHLCKLYKPKYASIHIHLLDVCSHRYWKYMEPELYKDVPEDDIRRHRNKIFDAYRFADRVIENIVNALPPDTLKIIASDHGFEASAEASRWTGNVTVKINEFAEMLGLEEDLNLSIIVPRIHCSIKQRSSEKSDYYAQLLSTIDTVEDEKPLFKVTRIDPDNFMLCFNEEIEEISGRHIRVNGRTFPVERFLIESEDFTPGVHDDRDAVLILNGPGVKRRGSVEESVSILDIAPTILALCNMPIGKDMDGRALTEAIEEEFLEKHAVRYIDTYEGERETSEAGMSAEEEEIIKKHLRSLGYL